MRKVTDGAKARNERHIGHQYPIYLLNICDAAFAVVCPNREFDDDGLLVISDAEKSVW
jgi:hypothetical protein